MRYVNLSPDERPLSKGQREYLKAFDMLLGARCSVDYSRARVKMRRELRGMRAP